MQPVTIITTYHFKASRQDAYTRLCTSLRSSLANLGGTGRIILVGNGRQEAEDPENVIAALPKTSTKIIPHLIETNNDISGALNDGIRLALNRPLGEGELIASVQSSVTLRDGWLHAVKGAMDDPKVGAAYGQIFHEEHPANLWNIGHFIREGCGAHNKRSTMGADVFPCFSACIIRRTLISCIVDAYGSLISYKAPHYLDCPDFAIRARRISPNCLFQFNSEARAVKRKPEINWRKLFCARLVAAKWYYDESKTAEAEARLRRDMEKRRQDFSLEDVRADAAAVIKASDSNGKQPMMPKCLDRAWSNVPCSPGCYGCKS